MGEELASRATGPRLRTPETCRTTKGTCVRAIQIHEHGDWQTLGVHDIPHGRPGGDDLLVVVEAAGVNFADVHRRAGRYGGGLPFVLGIEGAGIVVDVGEHVRDVSIGDRVAWLGAGGAYAEFAIVSRSSAVLLPEGLETETAAAVLLQGLTAHALVHSTYAVGSSDTVLAHAGAGGVGSMIVQLARARGARVIATVSSAAKASVARELGANEVIRYDVSDVPSSVARLTDGRGVDVVYDGVGAATFEASLESLRVRGLLVLFGAASGPVPPLDPQRLNSAGSVYLTRPALPDYLRRPGELEERARELFELVISGVLRVRISGRYALSDAARAHRDIEARATNGKLILLPELDHATCSAEV